MKSEKVETLSRLASDKSVKSQLNLSIESDPLSDSQSQMKEEYKITQSPKKNLHRKIVIKKRSISLRTNANLIID